MILWLMRHGIAIDREDPGCPDEADRFLTEEGQMRTRDAALGLAALELKPDRVLTSPYTRARQTAELAAAALSFPVEKIEESPHFLPSALAARTVALLAEAPVETVLACGHAPHLDELVAWLVGAPRPVTRLKKAGLAVVELASMSRAGGELAALYTPKVLRRLGS